MFAECMKQAKHKRQLQVKVRKFFMTCSYSKTKCSANVGKFSILSQHSLATHCASEKRESRSQNAMKSFAIVKSNFDIKISLF